jgi:sugar/nucleoside kinase (ribokinase family)
VDLVVNVDELPPADPAARLLLLAELTAAPPPMERWEVGGNTNTLIAAARLGMRAVAVGQVGNDRYGAFLTDILKARPPASRPPASQLR